MPVFTLIRRQFRFFFTEATCYTVGTKFGVKVLV